MSGTMIPLNGVLVDVEAARKAVAAFDEAAKQFKVGDWVVSTRGYYDGLPQQIVECPVEFSAWGNDGRPWLATNWEQPQHLRHATPEEIAAATRIVPKVGMLLEDKDSRHYMVAHVGPNSTILRSVTKPWLSWTLADADLTTTRYTIRDSVIIQGVR